MGVTTRSITVCHIYTWNSYWFWNMGSKMNNKLEQLEKKYAELGKEIERLKDVSSKKRERVAEDENYWYVGAMGNCKKITHDDSEFENGCFVMGNYFYSEAEAIKARDRRLAEQRIFDALREHEGDWVADWSNTRQSKYHFIYDHEVGEFRKDYRFYVQDNGDSRYYSSEEAWQWVIDNMLDDLKIVWWIK